MESLRLDPALAWILRTSLAALFATAVFHKLRDPRAFLHTFSEYEILPSRLTTPGALGLIAAEVLVVAGYCLDPFGVRPGLAALSLLLLYSLAIGLNLLRGRREIDCGCLGPASRQTRLSPWLLVRNGVLAFGAGATSLPVSERALHLVDGISVLGGFLMLVLLFNAIQLLAARTWLWPEAEPIS